MCAITGVLAIALPVPVIVSNFAFYYSREHGKAANADAGPADCDNSGTKGFAAMNCLRNAGIRRRQKRKKKRKVDSVCNGVEQEMDHKCQTESEHARKENRIEDDEINGNENNFQDAVITNDQPTKLDKKKYVQIVVANGVESTSAARETIV